MVNYYICATPYHVLNSVIIKKNYYEHDTNILLLTNNSRGSDKLYHRLIKEKVFDECIFVDDVVLRNNEANRIRQIKKTLKIYLNFKLVDNFVELMMVPDNIIVFSFTCFNTLTQSKLIRMNKKCNIYVGEDGIRDYIYKDFGISEPLWFRGLKQIRSFLGQPLVTLPNEYKRFLHRAEIRKELYNDNNSINILKGSGVGNLLPVINRLFEYTPDKSIIGKFIYFDSIYDEDKMLIQRKLVEHINAKFTGFVLKKHPRNTEVYEGVSEYPYSHIPWEVICMNCDMDNKVLITVNSNACFSPKFMMNYEPKIIFLYKFFLEGEQMEETKKLIDLLIKSYEKKNKIYVPESIDELDEILRRCEYNE